MKLPRRKFLHLAAGAAALPAVSRIARAQTYPSRPVRIIAGYPPGGSIDIHARLIGQWLSQRLGQPFVVENRPGAGGNVGSAAAAQPGDLGQRRGRLGTRRISVKIRRLRVTSRSASLTAVRPVLMYQTSARLRLAPVADLGRLSEKLKTRAKKLRLAPRRRSSMRAA